MKKPRGRFGKIWVYFVFYWQCVWLLPTQVGGGGLIIDFNYMNATSAVEVFFVISGFYMQMILREKYTSLKLGQSYVKKFYVSRYLRLMPIYLTGVVVTAVYLYISLDTFNYTEYVSSPTPVLEKIFNLSNSFENIVFKCYIIFTNVFLFFQDIVLNLGVLEGQASIVSDRGNTSFYVPQAMLIPQAWSLGIELSFYLLAPFMLKFANKTLIVAFCLLMVVKLGFIIEGGESDLYYRSFPFVLPYFLLGSLVYRYRKELNVFEGSSLNGRHLLHAYTFVIAVCLFLPVHIMAYSILLVIVCGLYLPTIFHVTKKMKVDRWLGELSYPIYVFHIFVYMVMANNWHVFNWLAIELNLNHLQIISLLTVFFVIVISALFVVVELKYVDPYRNRLIDRANWK